MGDIVIFFFIQNVIIFTMIFWLLTWISEYFYSLKLQTAKKQFYECGFRILSELNIQYNLNFSMLCAFLVLYDVEFILLYPLLFNYTQLTFLQWFIVYWFIGLVAGALIYDIRFNILGWQC